MTTPHPSLAADVAPSYSDRYHDTAALLDDLAGLAAALDDLIDGARCIDHQHPQAFQVHALVNVINEKTARAVEFHQREWGVHRAARASVDAD